MILEYDKSITDKFPGLFNVIQGSYLQNIIQYWISSDARRATNLKEWTKSFMDVPASEQEKAALISIQDSSDYDVQVLNCLKYVISNIQYKGDALVWKLPEKWQTPEETLNLKTGDCEDGAILLYRLCRLKGVPANRFLIFCGDVSGGGHCFLGYKPRAYPLNFAFLDWCYWANIRGMMTRPKFYIDKYSKIHEYGIDKKEVNSLYYRIWFGFNEDSNVKKFEYGLGRNREDLSPTSRPELFTN